MRGGGGVTSDIKFYYFMSDLFQKATLSYILESLHVWECFGVWRFGERFFSLFKFHITSEKHLFSIKIKEIIKKYYYLNIKVLIKYREGFIVPIRWHPFNNLN